MATRLDNDVTLSHSDADAVAKMLGSLADHYADSARRTRSAAVREASQRWAEDARRQAEAINRNLWTWTEAHNV